MTKSTNLTKKFGKTLIVGLMAMTLMVGCSVDASKSDTAVQVLAGETTAAMDTIDATSLSTSITATTEYVALEPIVLDLDEEKVDYDYEVTSTDVGPSPSYIYISESNEVTIDGDFAEVVNDQIVISAGGSYEISGVLTDGSIYIDAQDKGVVQLVLNNITISNDQTTPIYIEDAGEVIITLAEGSDNTIIDTSDEMTQDPTGEENMAAIFSKDDLTFNGSGLLTIETSVKNAVVSNDGLVIESGSYNIDAANNGLKGKDYLIVLDGVLNITAGEDGMKSTNYLEIVNGMVAINSTEDALHSGNALIIQDGDITINAGDDAIHGEYAAIIYDGSVNIESSYEGIEGYDIAIYGGDINIVATDDGMNVSDPNSDVLEVETDMMTMDTDLEPGQRPDMEEGRPVMDETDAVDGQAGSMPPEMSAEGEDVALDGANIGPGRGGDMAGGKPVDIILEGHGIRIYGGDIYILSDSDSVDSNGHIIMTDGLLVADGPETGAEGAIDYNGTFDYQGGTIMAAGSYGMSQSVSDVSTENAVLMFFDEVQAAGSTIKLLDQTGNVIGEHTAAKTYQTFVFASEDLEIGQTYSFTVDDVVVETFEMTQAHMLTGNETMVATPEPGPMGLNGRG